MTSESTFSNTHRTDRGAVAGEYAVLLAIIAVVLAGAITIWVVALGGSIDDATNIITGN